MHCGGRDAVTMQHWLDSRDVSGKLEPSNHEQDLGMHRCHGWKLK